MAPSVTAMSEHDVSEDTTEETPTHNESPTTRSLLTRTDGHALITSTVSQIDLDIHVVDTTPGELETIARHVLVAAGYQEGEVLDAIEKLPDAWDDQR